ncbi:unnamed protein product [Heligmosomoides polygyrus]|uniref:Zinc finger protein n=1 Tax=Heligmosomoides polygyrus TaxID=6339 RepID=A0A183G7Y6_HELPZ|nr:unnamed protein product [Heligmosomoides polygyrus]
MHSAGSLVSEEETITSKANFCRDDRKQWKFDPVKVDSEAATLCPACDKIRIYPTDSRQQLPSPRLLKNAGSMDPA